jgi:outer membrane protein assembly factor BamB
MRVLAGLAAILLMSSTCAADDWPQWRGPNRDGSWPSARLPEQFAADRLEPRWRRLVGGGYGGIAVADGGVYVLDRRTKPDEVERLLCLNARDGKELWNFSWPVRYGAMEYGNGPRSTPTVRKGRVYVFGAVGHLHCLDAANGKVIWSRDTVKEFQAQVPTWGHACSPLIDGSRLIVQVGAPDGCLMAFDLDSGKEVWRSVGDPPGYASPVLITNGRSRQFVYWTPENIVGIDADSGKRLWSVRFPITYGVSISDLVWSDGVLLASNYWSGCKALRFDAEGLNPEVAWEGKQLSLLMSTPLLHDGHVYALDRFKGLKCLSMKTGKVLWEDEYVTPKGRNPQASLVWAGERMLILNERGELLLADATTQGFRMLSRTKLLDGLIWAHPAYADGCCFVRSDTEIVCVPLGGK